MSQLRRPIPFRTPHRHRPVTQHFLRRREGIPYEVERVECSDCRRVLQERPIRRVA